MTGFQFAGLIVKRPGNHGEIAAFLEQGQQAELDLLGTTVSLTPAAFSMAL